MTSMFTFVNMGGTPTLNDNEHRLMRAHVTKTNFARRRKRIALEGRWQTTSHPSTPSSVKPWEERHIPWDPNVGVKRREPRHARRKGDRSLAQTSSPRSVLSIRPTDPHRSATYLLREFAALMFPPGANINNYYQENKWIELLASEPAFVEASMSVAVRSKPTFLVNGRPTIAEDHASKACALVNDRLYDPATAVTDGVLAAVFQLSFWELFMHGELAWAVHIDGLAKMIALRAGRHRQPIPTWFSDLLVYDGFSMSTVARKRRYQQILDALGTADMSSRPIDLAEVAEQAEKMRQGLNAHHRYHSRTGSDYVFHEIEEPYEKLRVIALDLQGDSRPFLRAFGYGMMLFLHLSRSSGTDVGIAEEAEQLRESLRNSYLQLCSTKNLTTWLFFIGGLASEPGSERRQWFAHRLRTVIDIVPITSWAEMVPHLQATYMPDETLLPYFKLFWEECNQAHSPP